jgi:hypothetical protein
VGGSKSKDVGVELRDGRAGRVADLDGSVAELEAKPLKVELSDEAQRKRTRGGERTEPPRDSLLFAKVPGFRLVDIPIRASNEPPDRFERLMQANASIAPPTSRLVRWTCSPRPSSIAPAHGPALTNASRPSRGDASRRAPHRCRRENHPEHRQHGHAYTERGHPA